MTDYKQTKQSSEDILEQVHEHFNHTLNSKKLVFSEDNKKVLNDIKNVLTSRYSENYEIICDETNNTKDNFDEGLINVTVIPPATIDKITLSFDK
jgi:bifunctional ADP-heptose synthase (sugar kinase/adenylyltransferase)